MKDWIAQYYLQPHHAIYLTLDFMRKYFLGVALGFAIIILAYPVTQYFRLNEQLYQQQREQKRLQEEIAAKEKLSASLTQNKQKLNDRNLANYNQQIKAILTKYPANISHIQWNLEQGKNVMLIFNQNSSYILPTLAQFNHLKNIEINEINLTKLNQERLVQAYIQLTFTQADSQ